MNYRSVDIPHALIVNLCHGSEQAFRDLFDLLGKKVFHYCVKKVGNPEDAEELLHDVFLKIWQFRENIDPSANFEIFLFTVARNHILNFARNRAAGTIQNTDALSEQIYSIDETHHAINYKDTYLQYQQVLATLGSKSRQVFELSREQGLSNKEIAGKMDISVRTVEKHVSNVLSIMRTELKEVYILAVIFLFF
jgi:RNA polymerase sigma-70 factor (ECF subfamily)